MRVIVFAGPTSSNDQIREILPEATVLPPAEQGDIDFARFFLGADVILLLERRASPAAADLAQGYPDVAEASG